MEEHEMENNFLCPKCNGNLNAGGYVIFSTKTNDGRMGLLMLHEKLGNYTMLKNPRFLFNSGDQLTFFCPLCHTELKSERHRNLSEIIMVDSNDQEYRVYFSEIAGEKSTYVLIGENVEVFGEHSTQYINFFNLASTL